ncbi:MAG: anhydro-N-acetylmuramic acid kinase [Gammaproteobacteria bacterium]|nr:anhydro-N-acetylmuramic acid kinase [Gammaproteobacteria bacterium]
MEGLFAGLMSGTSLDGVDAIILSLAGTDPVRVEWEVRGFLSRPYRPRVRSRIRQAIASGGARELAWCHSELARVSAGTLRALLEQAAGGGGALAAAGFHGQTVWHEPPHGGARGVTLQLGDAAALAAELGCPVVADFRSADMAAGGQGAPLVPWPDWVLLRLPGRGRALQNIGGMGNVTWLPAEGGPERIRGFDTGPGVALIDRAAELASGGRASMDRDGRRAASGRVLEPLLAELLADPFFAEPPPRSTGRERFGDARLDGIVAARPPESDADWNDLLATLTELTARSVALSYAGYLPAGAIDEVLVTGGGARNPTLVAAIRRHLAPLPVRTGARALGLDPDAREAAAFALLAWAHLNGIPGNVPAVTGARVPTVLGALYPAPAERAG